MQLHTLIHLSKQLMTTAATSCTDILHVVTVKHVLVI